MTSEKKAPLRAVVRRYSSSHVLLECGHTTFHAGANLPKRKQCKSCRNLALETKE